MTAILQSLRHSITMENKLKEKEQLLRTAMELLYTMTQTAEVQIQEGRSSVEDMETFVLSGKFLNAHYGKSFDTREVERTLDTL
jgi:hypothetical protein